MLATRTDRTTYDNYTSQGAPTVLQLTAGVVVFRGTSIHDRVVGWARATGVRAEEKFGQTDGQAIRTDRQIARHRNRVSADLH